MRSRGIVRATALVAGALVALGAAPAFGAGFLIFEHGAQAMGMAGAFTAQADDGSAMFHNAAGLAFQHERRFDVGTTLITNTNGEFQGAAPFPGPNRPPSRRTRSSSRPTPTTCSRSTTGWTFGVGFNDPFGLVVEWDNPDTFAGRFISYKAELRTFDLNPTLAWRAGANLGIGIGAIARLSDLELNQRVAVPSPFGGAGRGR